MVIEDCVGCPEVAVSRLDQAKAKVDVVVSDGEGFIQPFCFLEYGPANSKTGPGHCGIVLNKARSSQKAQTVTGEMFEGMGAHSADTENNPAVLNGVIRIKEFCSDGPDFRPLGLAHHFLQPFLSDGFAIVVQQQEDFPGCGFGSLVDQAGKVEGAGVTKDLDIGKLLPVFQAFEAFLLGASVIDDNDFDIGAAGAFVGQAFEALVEELWLIFGWYDDGDFWRSDDGVLNTEGAEDGTR